MNPAFSSSVTQDNSLKGWFLQSKWPHFSERAVGDDGCRLPEQQSQLPAERSVCTQQSPPSPLCFVVGNKTPALSSKTKMALFRKAEKCPFLLLAKSLPTSAKSPDCSPPPLAPNSPLPLVAGCVATWTIWETKLGDISFWTGGALGVGHSGFQTLVVSSVQSPWGLDYNWFSSIYPSHSVLTL